MRKRGGKSQGIAGSQESDHRDAIAPIATLFKDCLHTFERLCAATAESRPIGGEPSCSTVHGCFSKIRMWGTEIGAPDGSLDYALRKSSLLQQTTKDLLGDLVSTLCTSKTLVSPNVMKSIKTSISYHIFASNFFYGDISSHASVRCNFVIIVNFSPVILSKAI